MPGMDFNASERRQEMLDELDIRLRTYFCSMVDKSKQSKFKELSLKTYPSFAEGVYKKRKKLEDMISESSTFDFIKALEEYEDDSKRLIRIVSMSFVDRRVKVKL